ncbi:ras-related and estrogen-regulated growth inhibitor-like protein [Branchiostoma floridae x Branchiostoma japonicum]
MGDINLVVVGSESVGKSALTVRFLTRRYIGEYQSDTDIVYRHQTMIDGEQTNIEILDVSTGKGGDSLLTDKQIRWADGFVIVYSICDRGSFNRLRDLIRDIRDIRASENNHHHGHREQYNHYSMVIIGNKSDLEHRRTVSTEEGKALAATLECPFAEVSAADSYHDVAKPVQGLLRTVHDTKVMLKKRRNSQKFVNVAKALTGMFGGRKTTRKRRSL